MLYTVHKLPDEPIFIVRIHPPLHTDRRVYAIDMELLHFAARMPGRVYRIDDLTRLQPQHFTLRDAFEWFTGPIREDARWRGQVEHIAACRPFIRQMIPRIHQAGEEVYVPLFPDVEQAVNYTRLEIARHSGHR